MIIVTAQVMGQSPEFEVFGAESGRKYLKFGIFLCMDELLRINEDIRRFFVPHQKKKPCTLFWGSDCQSNYNKKMIKLMTWNCQGAFRKKYPLVADIAPDLAVIQECEQPERIPWKFGRPPTTALWFGENSNKGLGVFSWTNFTFQPLDGYDSTIRFCVPIQITSPYQFHLLAVWAMDHKQDLHSYSGQVYQAIGLYRPFIQAADTVFLGDYNSSKHTTPQSRMGNHDTITMNLNDLWLVSAYHQFYFEPQGQEKRWTYFRGRKIDRHYHIDFAFIPSRWLRRLANVQVGDPKVWLEHSDHCPVIVEIQEKEKGKIV